MLAVVVRELSEHQGAFLFDCCIFIARFASSSCYSSAKTRIRLVKSYHMCSPKFCDFWGPKTHGILAHPENMLIYYSIGVFYCLFSMRCCLFGFEFEVGMEFQMESFFKNFKIPKVRSFSGIPLESIHL